MIEWIPDILPFMKIGELRIKFEYGHQRNGQLEQRIQVHNRFSQSRRRPRAFSMLYASTRAPL